MKPILIKFGDNDFNRTFTSLLTFLACLNIDITKEQLLEFINKQSINFYTKFQNPISQINLTYKNKAKEEIESTKRYLQITMDKLYYGFEEVDNFLDDKEYERNRNYECFYWHPDRGVNSY